jgi:hypothetical protein
LRTKGSHMLTCGVLTRVRRAISLGRQYNPR